MQTRHLLALSLLVGTTALSAPAFAADLVVYDALDFAATAVKAFTAKTGITVDLVEPGSTGETLGKIAAEGSNPQFDLVWLDGSAVFERMLQDKVLQPVPDADFAATAYTDVGKTLIPADHACLPTSASTTAIMVNTKKVAAADMPKSWADLAHFAGKVAAKDPNLSGPSYQFIAGLFQTNGVDAGKALLKTALTNKTISGLPSNGKVAKAVLTGDAAVGIAQDSAIIQKQLAGEPVVAVYAAEGSVALPSCLGISATSQHMDAAQKFVAFVTSPEGQAAMQNGDDSDFYLIPLIKGVDAKKGRRTDIPFVVLDTKAASAHETEWKQWYRDNFVQ
jgi:iron(III) transport system substrate-binding protein